MNTSTRLAVTVCLSGLIAFAHSQDSSPLPPKEKQGVSPGPNKPTVQGPSISVQTTQNQTERDWERLDKSSTTALDQFIDTHPDSVEAAAAFVLRRRFLKISERKEEYHAFLRRHPNRSGSQAVLQELFELYEKLGGDDASRRQAYLEFARLYPGTLQGDLALRKGMHVACKIIRSEQGKWKDCVDFLFAFPESPYTELVHRRGKELKAKELGAKIKQAKKGEEADYASSMLIDLKEEVVIISKAMNKLVRGRNNMTAEEYANFAKNRANRDLLAALRFKFEHIYDAVFSKDPDNHLFFRKWGGAAYGSFLDTATLVDSIISIQVVLEHIVAQNLQTQELIRQEFANSRVFITAQLSALDAKLAVELNGLNRNLDTGFSKINDQLNELKVITKEGFDKAQEKLKELGEGIKTLQTNLQEMRKEVNQKLDAQAMKLEDIEKKVNDAVAGINALKDKNDSSLFNNPVGYVTNRIPAPISHTGERVVEGGKNTVDKAVETGIDIGGGLFGLGDMKIILFDIPIKLAFDANLKTGATWFRIESPQEFEFKTHEPDNLPDTSNVSIKLNPDQLMKLTGGAWGRWNLQSDYEKVRGEVYGLHKNCYVYFASERLVDFASPENGISKIAEIVCTLGARTSDVQKQVSELLRAEAEDIEVFLGTAAANEFDKLFLGLVEDIMAALNDRTLKVRMSGNFTISVKPYLVPYRWHYELTHVSGLPLEYFPENLRPTLPKQMYFVPESHHLAFAIIVKPPDGDQLRSSQELKSIVLPFFTSESKNISESKSFQRYQENKDFIMKRASTYVKNETIKKAIAGIDDQAATQRQNAKKLIFNELGISEADLSNIPSDGFIVDMRGSPAAGRLAELFSRLKVGNDAECHVEKMELDLAACALHVRVELRQKHSWGLKDAQKALSHINPDEVLKLWRRLFGR